ncbi:MAG: hypothetical protein IKS37_04090 [Solobacterium sp.]|nr:hypothetical protein [Solobacterium sp.]
MNWIIWLSVLWLPALLAYMNLNEIKAKKNIVLGVTLPQEGREDAQVQRILQTFKQRTIAAAACLLIVGIAAMFIPGRTMTLFMLWTVLTVIVPYIPYVLANRDLKRLKTERGWTSASRIVYADTGTEPVRYLHPLLFVPPVLIALCPILIEKGLSIMYVMMAVLCALSYVSYRYLYRNKAEMVDADTARTAALSRIRRYNWGKMWLISSYAMAFISLLSALTPRHPFVSFLLLGVLCIAICYEAVHLEMKTRKAQEKLTADSGGEWYVDDDEHWLGGLLYFNPDDSKTIINNRVGMNSSVNIARPAGMVLMSFLVILLAGMPVMGVWLDSLGTQPIVLSVDDRQLRASSGMTHYTIEREDIASAELREQLPERLARRFGTAMDHYLEGTFSDTEGAVKLLCDPYCPPYLYIVTKDGKRYLLASRVSEETIQAEQLLKE